LRHADPADEDEDEELLSSLLSSYMDFEYNCLHYSSSKVLQDLIQQVIRTKNSDDIIPRKGN